MHEPSTNPVSRTIYIPPKPNEVERFARHLCRTWAKDRAPEYGETEFVSGFVRFMKLVVQIQAKHLNRQRKEE